MGYLIALYLRNTLGVFVDLRVPAVLSVVVGHHTDEFIIQYLHVNLARFGPYYHEKATAMKERFGKLSTPSQYGFLHI